MFLFFCCGIFFIVVVQCYIILFVVVQCYIFFIVVVQCYIFVVVVVDLQPETVTQFLFDNPDFLDSFVQQHVHEDKIRQWSQRKHKVQGHNPVALTNGENF